MKRFNGKVRHNWFTVLGIVVVAALLMVAAASASPASPGEPKGAANLLAPQWDDGGAWEVGVETAGGDLWQYACSEGTALRDRLVSRGWVNRFLWCGGNAWEQDFKRAAAPGGGNEQNYLDVVDLMFYVGHGWTGSFTFDSNVDDHDLTPSDCYRSWGDGDNEWVGLTSCQVLSNPNLANWAACMYGGHQILGFVTNASARWGTASQGYNWAYYITNNWTVTGAWFKACDVSQPAGRVVRVLANELACYDDRPWSGIVCGDSFDTDAWFWDHTCGSELPAPTDVSAVTQMPVFRTPALSLDAAKAEYTNLGAVFGVPATPPATASALSADPEIWRATAGTAELEMEKNSGLFTYYDMNLWSAPAAQAALAPRAASITPQDAKTIADKFLADNKLLPPDAKFYDVASDKLAPTAALSGAGMAPAADTVYQVIYSRHVTATVALAAGGPAVTQDFLVVGPGAKLKVYVPISATLTSAAGLNGLTVSGVQGGWRDVQAPTAASAIDTVPILTEAQIRKAYEKVESFVVLNTPPIDADGREVISPTLAYWEEGVSSIQSQLIPTYGLYVKYTKGGELLNYDWAYVPANQTYMRPYAKIVSGPTAPVKVGATAMFTAADATQTLAALGIDPILTFTLGSGDGPYLYEWFVDSVAPANLIGQGKTLSYKVQAAPGLKGSTYKQTIVLRVTDQGSDDLRSSIASYSIEIYPRVALPFISR